VFRGNDDVIRSRHHFDAPMRTIVDIPQPERSQIDAICSRRAISRASAVREALRTWLKLQHHRHEHVFALWADRTDLHSRNQGGTAC